MEKGEKFLSGKETAKRAKNWKGLARRHESLGKELYYVARKEREGELTPEQMEHGTVDLIHGVSFIREVLPNMLAAKKPGEKVRVLDVGGGAAMYAEQIRKVFGASVEVMTTGLSKRFAKAVRKGAGAGPLHKDDLKWRSVVELSDYPEFDLIIDTYGEVYYATQDSPKEMLAYLEVILAKLLDEGMASIAPFRDRTGALPQALKVLSSRYSFDANIADIHDAERDRDYKALRIVRRKAVMSAV